LDWHNSDTTLQTAIPDQAGITTAGKPSHSTAAPRHIHFFRTASPRKIKTMRIPLFHVDAFTDKPFAGNPAAVCLLQGWLDDALLRKVAAENNLSETAFLVPAGSHYDIRWFNPRGEVKLCGHATLASAYILLNVLQSGGQTVRFETRFSEPLLVYQDGDLLSMDFPALPPKMCKDLPKSLLLCLASDTPPSHVLETNQTYIAVYEDETLIQNLRPNFTLMETLHPYVVSVTAPGQQVDFVSRYFKPSYGMPEDPVTGSAHCALTPYWADRLGRSTMHARQLSERGGELWCEMSGTRVILKGRAVLTMKGSLEV
jgi:PhzF family phenazine biosynthesis protein